MVLREILKTDTSASVHTQLNDYHKIEENKSKNEKIDYVEESSLLSDPERFADFKKAIFATTENEKRKRDDVDVGDSKKLKNEETS